MARIFSTVEPGDLSWSSLNPNGSGTVVSNTAGTLRPGSEHLFRAAARGDTLVVAGVEPAAVYVYEGQTRGQGRPVLRHTITSFLGDDCPFAVALSPDGQSVAVGTDEGEGNEFS
jgi:hypothetical protein